MRVAFFAAPSHMAPLRRAAAAWELESVATQLQLETCDEFMTRKWFNHERPDLVIFVVDGRDLSGSRKLLLAAQGGINVLSAGIGNTSKLRVLGINGGPVFEMLKMLCQAHRSEKSVDFRARKVSEVTDLVGCAVLCMRELVGLSAEEADACGQKGKVQGQEVREPVVPQ